MEITKNTKQVKSAVWPCHVWTYDTASVDFEKNCKREKGKYIDYLLSAENDWHPAIYFRFTDCPVLDGLVDDQGTPVNFQYCHERGEFMNFTGNALFTKLSRMLNDHGITVPQLLEQYNFTYERFYSSNEIYIDYFLIRDVEKLCNLIEKLVKKRYSLEQILKEVTTA